MSNWRLIVKYKKTRFESEVWFFIQIYEDLWVYENEILVREFEISIWDLDFRAKVSYRQVQS